MCGVRTELTLPALPKTSATFAILTPVLLFSWYFSTWFQLLLKKTSFKKKLHITILNGIWGHWT